MLQINKIKILHIIPPVQYGGGESVIKDIILNTKAEIDSEVLLLCRSRKFEIKLEESKIKFIFFDFKELPPNTKTSNFLFLFFKIIFNFSFRKVEYYKYDILHCHGFPSLFLGLFFKTCNNNVKIIYTHHQQVFKSNILIVKLFEYVYNKFDHLTFVSNTISNSFCKKFKIKTSKSIIYNPVSNSFYPQNNKFKIANSNKNNFKLIYLSRFSKQKAHYDLIKTFIHNKKVLTNNNIVIYFYGDGSEIYACKKLVNDNNLENNFIFMGFVDQSKLPLELLKYDIAIFPSKYEGFGVAAAECIASELPVIYNSINETLVEIVEDAGWGVSLEDMPIFIKNLTYEIIKEKIESCKIQRSKFKEEIISKKYINIYKSLI
jgi:glycosyltransferase involved in cell wall biosynthesis